MYFLTEEEKKRLLKGFLPKSREIGVADELRGWNWAQPPLEPMYDCSLALYEVAGGYCPTGRDVFMRRVEHIKTVPNQAMIQGSILHELMVNIIVEAKKLIYIKGVVNYKEICQNLLQIPPVIEKKWEKTLSPDELNEIRTKAEILKDFETSRIIARIQEILIKQPYIGEDSLVSLAIPVVVEQKLDGTFLGLSSHLSADAFTFSEPMMLDLKFGEKRDFHRLTTTGYAMVMEAIYEFPVNIGCIVYAEFKNERLIISKDIHIIDDELRQWFIETRDEKMRMVYEEIDPGVANKCYESCPYYENCHE
ncbi:type I-A CRISPR-associated protein Cas4/Csa1 [Phosphitispora sp. TUW77]|uniref:type I-A CRISPR-associated protein Cas4/Csa1 n=1 Tax=Phosphitispora sp. TUW77 TaxID=3152361 RepID=UPI003AB56156